MVVAVVVAPAAGDGIVIGLLLDYIIAKNLEYGEWKLISANNGGNSH